MSIQLNNIQLELKSAGVGFAILTAADYITKDFCDCIKSLNDITQDDINKIFFVTSYMLLDKAQKFILENYIQYNENAEAFNKYLCGYFQKVIGVDPVPYIDELFEYKARMGLAGDAQYIGSKICKELNKEDVILMLEISSMFNTFLLNGFLNSMKRAWDFSDETLKEMQAKAEQGNK